MKKAQVKNMRVRYESFGGIIRSEEPPATIYVDKNYMKELGYYQSKLWEEETKILSAPIDVHFALTNECPLECKHCYKSSGLKENQELTIEEIKRIIDVLSEMHIFSIAFGGGEPFARKEIFEIAEYTKSKGIIPNITTNGWFITKENAAKCKVFGHMHISLDLPDHEFDKMKNTGAFDAAEKAIDLLLEQGIHIGINCVISKHNFNRLEELVKFCLSKGIKDISFLRFKPIGKANEQYSEMRLTYEQSIKLFPKLKKLSRKYKISTQIDCSMVPYVAFHKPNYRILDFYGAQGCEGGNTFIEIKEDGTMRSCSFSQSFGDNAALLQKNWLVSKYFKKYREVVKNLAEPCNSCKYVEICRGGCHVISEFLTGDFNKPDPECPIVVKYHLRNQK